MLLHVKISHDAVRHADGVAEESFVRHVGEIVTMEFSVIRNRTELKFLFPFPIRQKHEKGFTVCGMAWHPAGGQIAYTDTEGCLGLLDGVCASSSSTTTKNTTVGLYMPHL